MLLLSPYQKLVLLKLLGKKSFILVIVKIGFSLCQGAFLGAFLEQPDPLFSIHFSSCLS